MCDNLKVEANIFCVPRVLTPKQQMESAQNAINVNPVNRSSLSGVPSYMLKPSELSKDFFTILIAATTRKLWPRDPELTVGFIDTTPVDLQDRIVAHLSAWGERGSGISFKRTANINDAVVKINRETHPDPKENGYWSYIGTDAMIYSGEYGQTMNLQEFTMNTPESEFRRIVRHEGGHVLGFEHEHLRQDLVSRIDSEKAIKYYRKTEGWDKQHTIENVLTPLDEIDLTSTPFSDPTSIMAYDIPDEILKHGAQSILGGLDINDADFDFVTAHY